MENKRKTVQKIRENVQKCEEFEKEIAKLADLMIFRIRNEAEMIQTALIDAKNAMEREIAEAVSEFEGKIYEENVVWESKLAEMMYENESWELFECGLQPCPERVLGSYATYRFYDVREPQPMLSAQPPVAVAGGQLVFFLSADPPFPVELELGSSYSATFVSETQLFLCGGLLPSYALSSSVFLLDKGDVLTLPSLQYSRHSHGLFYESYWPFVYVFGGETICEDEAIHLRKCERFALETGQWETMPDMQTPRAMFNPCLQGRVIYLCGGIGAKGSVETYSPALNLMKPVSILLPEDTNGYFGCTTLTDGDSLVIISRNTVTRWNPVSAEIQSNTRPQTSDVWSLCRPVLQQRNAYVVNSDFTLRVIDVDSGDVMDEVRSGV